MHICQYLSFILLRNYIDDSLFHHAYYKIIKILEKLLSNRLEKNIHSQMVDSIVLFVESCCVYNPDIKVCNWRLKIGSDSSLLYFSVNNHHSNYNHYLVGSLPLPSLLVSRNHIVISCSGHIEITFIYLCPTTIRHYDLNHNGSRQTAHKIYPHNTVLRCV